MKIVYITNIPSPYQIEWAKALREIYEVEFWFMIDINDYSTGRPGYWNIELPSFCKILPSRLKKFELGYGPTLVSELNHFNPDIVMLGAGWYMISWSQGYRWAVKNNRKILAGPIEFGSSMYNISKILRNRFIYRILYKKIDLYLANAFIHYDYLGMALGLKNKTLFMNYDQYRPYLMHSNRKKNKNIKFLYAGAIDRRMRVPEVILTFKKLVKKYPGISLTIGGYGPEKSQCIDLVKNSSELKHCIFFHDVESWDEIPSVYEQSSVLINYASFSPGSGVILAAIASGMGIISTISINASRHFLIDKYNGYFVKDENELFLAMENYIDNPKLVNVHSVRSREIAQCTLTFDEHIKDFKKAINSLFPEI